jgi:hypothetical protein
MRPPMAMVERRSVHDMIAVTVGLRRNLDFCWLTSDG